MIYNLERFIIAQEKNYDAALSELTAGKKQSHWMWYIFPQLEGLGRSETAQYYGIKDISEAQGYLSHPILGSRLISVSKAVLEHNDKTAKDIFGFPDYLKLHSSMTLFASLATSDVVFNQVLKKYFDGKKDLNTTRLLTKQ
ncbi:DUF1810 domain-containing protein [Pedobacter sandarakinus]|uniref:DUF1810 domain-containing protein n=1 Tax=Pedobacter sandarakinus TaxID=353156 RepID=UPI00224503F6|nr:DUF1810 domain-containing protein [Pedobacter sandarakinus]MCX2573131.1 DUF1810 domain-containing protein [Pedobacter sandarakinus]